MDATAVATWGLVVATGLLVLAALIPVVSSSRDRRRQQQVLAAEVMPDLNFIHERLLGSKRRLLASINSDSTHDVEDFAADDSDDLLEMLSPVAKRAHKHGLEFTNDIAVVRHLITQAKIETREALEANETSPPDRVQFTESVQRAARLCLAASNMVKNAEKCLSNHQTMIGGESFNERFLRLSKESEELAEKRLVEERYRSKDQGAHAGKV